MITSQQFVSSTRYVLHNIRNVYTTTYLFLKLGSGISFLPDVIFYSHILSCVKVLCLVITTDPLKSNSQDHNIGESVTLSDYIIRVLIKSTFTLRQHKCISKQSILYTIIAASCGFLAEPSSG
jgi:predicted ABC-type exoprotein transport system permease subunit